MIDQSSNIQHFIWSVDQIVQIQKEKIYLPESVRPVPPHQCPDTLEKRKFSPSGFIGPTKIQTCPMNPDYMFLMLKNVIALYFHLQDGELNFILDG